MAIFNSYNYGKALYFKVELKNMFIQNYLRFILKSVGNKNIDGVLKNFICDNYKIVVKDIESKLKSTENFIKLNKDMRIHFYY